MATKKLVYGIGINDSDYVTNPTVDGKREKCKIYSTWQSMLERCYDTDYIEKYLTYVGCSVSKDWHSFMNFRTWMLQQDYEGKQLDKDLLVRGNKVYSENTCVFISRALNMFMTESTHARSTLPTGVSIAGTKYKAQCSDPFTKTTKYLGVFSLPEEAHAAWKQYKHVLALKYSELEIDPKIVKALQTRYLN